jgi:hypothetical protein
LLPILFDLVGQLHSLFPYLHFRELEVSLLGGFGRVEMFFGAQALSLLSSLAPVISSFKWPASGFQLALFRCVPKVEIFSHSLHHIDLWTHT